MKNTDDNKLPAGLSHDLKAQIDAVSSYSRLIADESADEAVREYAGKIKEASDKLKYIIDSTQAAVPAEKPANQEEPSVSSAQGFGISLSADEDISAPTVLVVDDDELIRAAAQDILGKLYNVITVESGEQAVSVAQSFRAALILLDINMPGMDGFETLARIKKIPSVTPVPVVFLTGDDGRDNEIRCFKEGASDFVKKPFVAQVLIERVRRIIELDRLQYFLSREVAVQTRRSARLSNQIMLALSKAVDAKDHYTNGHSQRVAAYSREIARRLGRSTREQEDIYAMGLLHDIGKIGVSEAIINKTSRLNDEEYAQIKTHTTTGYGILKIITEIPGLATGARWHHERFDGHGYPDGLSGEQIPEEARIICVADCYDAMTSKRSYSSIREQSAVRAEIVRCSGTQFDPRIAQIMVEMIDDDPDYLMSDRLSRANQGSEPATVPFVPSGRPVTEKDIPPVPPVPASKPVDEDELEAQVKERFYAQLPSVRRRIADAYSEMTADRVPESYRLAVHSLKSTAAMAGLTQLSDTARQLEAYAKASDTDGIRSLHPSLMAQTERLCAQINAKAQEKPDKPDGSEVLGELLEMVRIHMENMDTDAADDTLKLILSYSYNDRIQGLIKELEAAVLDLDEERADSIIDEINTG